MESTAIKKTLYMWNMWDHWLCFALSYIAYCIENEILIPNDMIIIERKKTGFSFFKMEFDPKVLLSVLISEKSS